MPTDSVIARKGPIGSDGDQAARFPQSVSLAARHAVRPVRIDSAGTTDTSS